MYLRQLSLLLLLTAFISCAPTKETTQTSADHEAAVAEIISELPAEDQAEMAWINNELINAGPSGMRALVGMLHAPGNGNDTRARYAVNGLAKYVSSSEADTNRQVYEGVLLEELNAPHSKAVKAFLMEQLELMGSDAAVPVLQAFIGDDQLNESAVHALRAIHSDNAEEALLEKLSDTEGKKQVAIIKALGDMETSGVEELLAYSSSDNEQIKEAALYALAKTGDPAAETALREAIDSSESSQLTQAYTYYLMYAHRLADEGHRQQSSEIYRDLIAGEYPVNVKNAALSGLVDNEGDQASDALLAAAGSGDYEFRSAALKQTDKLSGRQVTDIWVAELEQADSEVQADIIDMLGRRGDETALPELLPYLESDDLGVRVATIQAITYLGDTDVLATLIERTSNGQQQKELAALKTALLQYPTDDVVSAASEALPTASERGKVILIEVLSERRARDHLATVIDELEGSEESVRMVIYRSLQPMANSEDLPQLLDLLPDTQNTEEQQVVQQAIVATSEEAPDESVPTLVEAYNEAPDDQKPTYLAILSAVGTTEALDTVSSATQSSNSTVSNAAITELAGWPNAAAIPHLRDVIEQGTSENQSTALEGYIRLVTDSRYSPEDKVRLLGEILPAVSSSEEKASVIEAHAAIQSPAALRAITGYLTDSDEVLKEASLRASAALLAPSYNQVDSNDEADKVLSVLESTTSSETREQVEQYIVEYQNNRDSSEEGSGGYVPSYDMESSEESGSNQPPEEFVALFNGENWNGWVGDTEGYTINNGQIISKSGENGNIFTEKQYADFNLTFDFKLTAAANNGLGIRSPLKGNPIELQILDNNAEVYSDLEPYQYHGSIYGVVPAERGHLNNPGEWNSQEVIAQGSQVIVRLNGVTIVDADLEEVGVTETGDEIPRLLRNKGHLGFLGHGDEVAFKNIFIQEIPRTESLITDNMDGWQVIGVEPDAWKVKDGILYTESDGRGWLSTTERYDNFELEFEYKLPEGGNSGVFLRAPQEGSATSSGIEIQLLNDNADQYMDLQPWQYTGSIYGIKAPSKRVTKGAGEWQTMKIIADGPEIQVTVNDEIIINTSLVNYMDKVDRYPGLKGRSGFIGFQNHNTNVDFRNIKITEIK